MPDCVVNAKHDAASHGSCGCKREISDGNALYDAFVRAKQGSGWKPQVQQFEMNLLFELAAIQSGLEDGSYELSPTTDFVLSERGKTRAISGEHIRDRVTKHSLCDEMLTPAVRKHLIYDNGASLEGKGIGFSRKRLLTHLRKYYARHGSNEGYILLIDYSKYYDNIRHDELMRQFRRYVHDETALMLLGKIIDRAKVDVSYMTDEEYARCMETQHSSLGWRKIDPGLLTGEKFMRKHLSLGDQVAQIAGVMYPTPVDNYVKTVRGVKYYGRYMDDSYVIHESKEYLQDLLKGIIAKAKSIGITVHEGKTRICKLSDYWRYLQIQYSLTETGRVVQKINPKRITCMRRKMKKLAAVLPEKEFGDWYNAWISNHCRIMSKQQRQNMNILYQALKEAHYVHNNARGRD